MINFSHDDQFLLAASVDNEINQFMFLDGRKHLTYRIPKTGSKNNFTRAYYSMSGKYVMTGSCEEKTVRLLSVHSGEVLAAAEIFDGRRDDSIYVQSLRGSPLDDLSVCVLTNYRDVTQRELVLARPVPAPLDSLDSGYDGLQYQSQPMDCSDSHDEGIHELDCWFYSNGFAQDLANLRHQARRVSCEVQVFPQGQVAVAGGEWSAQLALLLHRGGGCAGLLWDQQLFLHLPASLKPPPRPGTVFSTSHQAVHRFVLKARCPQLYSALQLTPLRTPSHHCMWVADLSDSVPAELLPLLPVALDHLYAGDSSLDLPGLRFLVLSLLLGDCVLAGMDPAVLLAAVLPSELFRQLQQDPLSSSSLVMVCRDAVCWRLPFFSRALADVALRLELLARRLDLPNLQIQAQQLLSTSLTVSNASRVFLQARRRGCSPLDSLALRFVTNHWPLIRHSVATTECFAAEDWQQLQTAVLQEASVLRVDVLPSIAHTPREACALPCYVGHSACPVLSDCLLLLGGVSRERFHPLSRLLLFQPASNLFQVLSAAGPAVPASATQNCVALQRQGAHLLLLAAGKAGPLQPPRQHSSLTASAVFREHCEGRREEGPDSGDRLLSLDDALSPQSPSTVPYSSRALSEEGEEEDGDGVPVPPQPEPQPDPQQQEAMDLFYQLDLRSLTWTSPTVSLQEAQQDVGGSVLHPLGLGLGQARSRNRRAAERSLVVAARRRQSQSLVPLYQEDLPYRCRHCLFTDRTDRCHCGLPSTSPGQDAEGVSTTWLLQFGGYCTATSVISQDLHVLCCETPSDPADLTSGSSFRWLRLRASGVPPSGRYSHSAAIVPCRSRPPPSHDPSDWDHLSHSRMLVLGGGTHQDDHLACLRFEHLPAHRPQPHAGSDLHWERLLVSGSIPQRRSNSSLVHLPFVSQPALLLFGGMSQPTPPDHVQPTVLGDLAVLVLEGLHWYTDPAQAAAPPLPNLANLVNMNLGGQGLVQGLQGLGRDLLAAAWQGLPLPLQALQQQPLQQQPLLPQRRLVGLRVRWDSVATSGVPPSCRCRHSCSVLGDKVLVFGGQDQALVDAERYSDEDQQELEDGRRDSLVHVLLLHPSPTASIPSPAAPPVFSWRGEWLPTGCLGPGLPAPSGLLQSGGQAMVRQPLCRLGQQLGHLLQEEEDGSGHGGEGGLWDLCFLADSSGLARGVVFRAVSVLVRQRCEWMAALLRGGMREARTGQVRLPGAQPAAARALLRFLCADSLSPSLAADPQALCELCELGCQYNLPRLVALCEGLLLRALDGASVATVQWMRALGEFLRLELLQEACRARLLRLGLENGSEQREHVYAFGNALS
eukprot:CAMPEP_0201092996 /NCGR_PEP_ID=MMETSP0812-20130820/1540_1 /ASSEMBLY_ACC=CAM_ASM_000668 /TAXON_ID=98059 /ORGANISM="Dinobryon sp., Strain UTEXLB2267" /LENGTH=1332 /DNA_ID=CAMNT_0047344899 /DNA_START=624 /DNA_END=4622 /DNA_ORIENTATION=+